MAGYANRDRCRWLSQRRSRAAKVAPDAPVTDVTMHLLVSANGTVENAEVVKPVSEDLDAEATKVVSKWVFEPGTCDGRPQQYEIDVTVHFQGRR